MPRADRTTLASGSGGNLPTPVTTSQGARVQSLSTDRSDARHALYYPFHLCQECVLECLLRGYTSVHFRDYMALQLTRLTGTTAYADRMGDRHPELVQQGRIVQGYGVSGRLDPAMTAAVARDLEDPVWRARFHRALAEDRRVRHGLFDVTHGVAVGGQVVPGPAAFLELITPSRQTEAYSIERIQRLADARKSVDEGYVFEYGLALLKTSAALHHTVRLAVQHGLEAVTDSAAHFELLEHIRLRDAPPFVNRFLSLDNDECSPGRA